MKNRPTNRNLPLPQYTYRQNLKKEEVKVYKRVALIIAASLVVILIIWFMGTTFLSILGSIANGKHSDNEPKKTSNLPLQTPKIDKLPKFTNKDHIDITGSTSSEVSVKLTVNGKEVDTQKTDTSGSFTFTAVPLDLGLNSINVTATDSNDKTEQADTTITLDTTKPPLAIASPVDGASYPPTTTKVNVTGTTEGQAKVYVNGSQAVVDYNGGFSYNLPVVSGSNSIEVASTDQAGNTTTIKIAITVE